jgi:hypothetical protein
MGSSFRKSLVLWTQSREKAQCHELSLGEKLNLYELTCILDPTLPTPLGV